MKTYLSKIVFQIQIDNNPNSKEFDRQFRIIPAADELQALEKARTIAQNEEESFVNANGRITSWKFVGISDLVCLDEIAEGSTVYTDNYETDDPKRYIRLVKERELAVSKAALITPTTALIS